MGSNPTRPNVVPVTMTMVNWPALISESTAAMGKSVTKRLDDYRINLTNSLAAFVQAFGFLESPEISIPAYFIKDEYDQYLDLVTMGFLITSDHHAEIMIEFGLIGRGNAKLQVYQTTIAEWRMIVVNACRTVQDPYIRYIGNKIFEYLDQAGFRDAFYEYSKDGVSDGTFTLCKQN